uniref:Uncharacterized protein n=1 Tax=Oryza meridionalis TaxID=40149 RepID=A0A0E0F0K5_9ORYZ
MEEEEESKFVPLNAEDPMYGPPVLLLIGFEEGETDKVQEFLRELDGEFLKVIHCTEEMTEQTLWDAMHTEQPSIEAVKIAKSIPRICIFSGLTGEEMMMFINAFPETGLEAAFAALVPNSADKILGEVIEEIMGDHEMLTYDFPAMDGSCKSSERSVSARARETMCAARLTTPLYTVHRRRLSSSSSPASLLDGCICMRAGSVSRWCYFRRRRVVVDPRRIEYETMYMFGDAPNKGVLHSLFSTYTPPFFMRMFPRRLNGFFFKKNICFKKLY